MSEVGAGGAGESTLERDFLADPDALSRLTEEVEAFVAAGNEESVPAQRISLAIDELITNIINYGSDDGTPVRVHVEVRRLSDEVRVVIEHRGVAFDPFVEAPTPDITLPLEERPIGGLGVFLVKSLMSSTRYERIGDRNRITLSRTLPTGDPEGSS